MGFELPVQIVDDKWCGVLHFLFWEMDLDVGLCQDDLELVELMNDCHLASSGSLPLEDYYYFPPMPASTAGKVHRYVSSHCLSTNVCIRSNYQVTPLEYSKRSIASAYQR